MQSVLLYVLAVLGVLGAGWSVPESDSGMAVSVVGFFCLAASMAWFRVLPDEAAKRDLPQIVLLAVVVRLGVFIAVRQSVGPYVFAPDAWAYETVGGEIVGAWQGLRDLPTRATETFQVGYYYLNAAMHWVFGPSPAAPATLNVFLGAWTTIPVYLLARAVVKGNRGVGRCAAYLVALFPSLVLWSVLNLREAGTILLFVSALYLLVRIRERLSLALVIGVGLCLLGIVFSRGYLAVLVGVAAPTGFLMARGKSLSGSLVGGLALLALLVAGLGMNGFGSGLATGPALETLEAMRQGLSFGAQTAYGATFDVSTVGGALQFLPVGLTYYLFSPFPWDLGSTLQSVALPEMLLWYALIPFTLRGLVLGLRNDARSFMIPLAVLLAVAIAYGLVQGNVGTAFRHRAQVLPLVFIFTAVGLRDWHGRRLERRRLVRERRRQADGHLAFRPLEETLASVRNGL